MSDTSTSVRFRQALVIGLTLYGIVCLRSPETFRIIDALNLAIHETGHILFTPFGEFMHFLGGTLVQVAFPLLFVIKFARQGDRFAAYLVCWWIAQSLWNVSVYIADARAQALPLVGGGAHDWAYLLGRLGWLEHDLMLSRLVHLLGIVVFGWAMIHGWLHVREGGGVAEPLPDARGTSPALPGAAPLPARPQSDGNGSTFE